MSSQTKQSNAAAIFWLALSFIFVTVSKKGNTNLVPSIFYHFNVGRRRSTKMKKVKYPGDESVKI